MFTCNLRFNTSRWLFDNCDDFFSSSRRISWIWWLNLLCVIDCNSKSVCICWNSDSEGSFCKYDSNAYLEMKQEFIWVQCSRGFSTYLANTYSNLACLNLSKRAKWQLTNKRLFGWKFKFEHNVQITEIILKKKLAILFKPMTYL